MRISLVLVSLLGTVQALFLAGALVVRRVNQRANRLLAALLLAMAVYLGNGAYQAADLVAWWPVFLGWSHPMPLLFGPLLYLYARSVTDAERPMRGRDAWHFAPALVVIAWSLPVYLLPGGEKVALFEGMRAGDVPLFVARILRGSSWLKVVSGAVYTAITVRLVLAHRRAIRNQYSTLDRVTLDWLLILVVASAIVWSVAIGARFIEPSGRVPLGTGDYIVAMLMVLATYAIGYRGLQQSAAVRADADPRGVTKVLSDAVVPSDAPVQSDAVVSPLAATRADRTSLTPGMANAIEERLRVVMRDAEPWREVELTLGDLAERVGTTTHKLSEVLNTRVQQSFHDYVNGFRVREVQRQLARPDAASRTMLSIAQDAGFASKSTFNAVFRRVVGMTPTAWREGAGGASSAGAHVRTDPSGRPAR